MKKKIFVMLSVTVSLLCVSAIACLLNAARCTGVDGDRGSFKCKGSGDCVIVQGSVSVECKGKRVYESPLVLPEN